MITAASLDTSLDVRKRRAQLRAWQTEWYQIDRSLGQRRNFVLGGESGMGKTTYLDWLIFNNLPVSEKERNHVPIIGIQAPVSNQTARPLLWRMILECGQTFLKNDNEEILLMKLALYLQKCGVELMVIDEIQHIKRHELKRRVLEVSNMVT